MSGHSEFKAIGPNLPPAAPQPAGPVGVQSTGEPPAEGAAAFADAPSFGSGGFMQV